MLIDMGGFQSDRPTAAFDGAADGMYGRICFALGEPTPQALTAGLFLLVPGLADAASVFVRMRSPVFTRGPFDLCQTARLAGR